MTNRVTGQYNALHTDVNTVLQGDGNAVQESRQNTLHVLAASHAIVQRRSASLFSPDAQGPPVELGKHLIGRARFV